jgi:cytochrome c biogenesis protein CcmG, thiol:disulfide interchange protein DsbE
VNPELRLRLGWIAAFLLFAAAALLLYIDFKRYHAKSGSPAPDVTLQTLTGSRQQLRTSFGKPLIVNFFATWCVPCKAELPLLESRYARMKAEDLMILGVDEQETAASVRSFTREQGVTYPVVIDSGPAFDEYGGHAIPTSLFIDSKGVLQAVHVGYLSPK